MLASPAQMAMLAYWPMDATYIYSSCQAYTQCHVCVCVYDRSLRAMVLAYSNWKHKLIGRFSSCMLIS